MCDAVPGELVISFPKFDEGGHSVISDIRNGNIEHVLYVDSLSDRLKRLEVKEPTFFNCDFHRVRVPEGQEIWKITYLQYFYKLAFGKAVSEHKQSFFPSYSQSMYQFNVEPNWYMSLCAPWPPRQWIVRTGPSRWFRKAKDSPILSSDFIFHDPHYKYKDMFMSKCVPQHDLSNIRIAIIDSGISSDFQQIKDSKNCIDDTQPAIDDIGHGTAIARIINDIAPSVSINTMKSYDAKNGANLFSTLLAISCCSEMDVVNISLAFGLEDYNCPVCGRLSMSARSNAFETHLHQFQESSKSPVFVAAAGNRSEYELTFPARIRDVVAIGSLNSGYRLSSFSNKGAVDHTGAQHMDHYVLPGGDEGEQEEIIGGFATQKFKVSGTSFAAAYASGLIARLIALHDISGSKDVRNCLRKHAFYDDLADVGLAERLAYYGNGLLKLPVVSRVP